jgi:hypothetical protein
MTLTLSVTRVITLAVLVVAQRADAQGVISTLDLGGSDVRYADSVNASAFTVSPGLQMNFDRATLGASGSYSRFGSGSWTTQGALGGSLYTPAAGPLLGELSGSAGGSAHEDGTRTGESLGMVRGHLMGSRRGVWIGAGAGTTWDGGGWRRLFEGEAGLWSRFGANTTALATITPMTVNDSIRYSDAELAIRWDGSRLEIGATAGRRSGRQWQSSRSPATWGSVSLAAWFTPHAAVVGSIGSYPVDLTQGFPGGQFVSIALRVGTRSPRHDAEQVSHGGTRVTEAFEAEPIRQFAVSAVAEGQRTIRVLAPNATTVELTADFTDWSPVRLTRSSGGWWSVTLPVTPGSHQVNVRLDGGTWLVPPSLTTLHDEFGGEVGLMVVPL